MSTNTNALYKAHAELVSEFVIPAKAGIQKKRWIPGQARNDTLNSMSHTHEGISN
jgi:hypothetical protein